MLESIGFMGAQAAANYAAAASAGVSGMSIGQAQTSIGGGDIYDDDMWVSNKKTGGASSPYYTDSDVEEAFSEYVQAGGATSPNGRASSGQTDTVNVTVYKDKNLLTKVGAVLTYSCEVICASVLPLLGIFVGAAFYELCKEEWLKIKEKIKENSYENKEAVPAVMDSAKKVYVRKDTVDSVVNYVAEKIGKTSDLETGFDAIPTANKADINATGTNSFRFREYSDVQYTCYLEREYWIEGVKYLGITFIVATDNSSRIPQYKYDWESRWTSLDRYDRTAYIHNDSVAYIWNFGINMRADVFESMSPRSVRNDKPLNISYAGWTMVYGEDNFPWDSYPGLMPWRGTVPVDYTVDAIEVGTGVGNETKTYIPLYINSASWGESADGVLHPDPQDESPPDAINPGMIPTIPEFMYPDTVGIPPFDQREAPIPNPTSTGDVSVDPEADPSEIPEDIGQDLPEIPQPSSSGSTSIPDFPSPNFPSINLPGRGVIHVYRITAAEFMDFADWLWVTYEDVDIHKILNNPFDGVIGAFELYTAPPTSEQGTVKVRCGFLVSDADAYLVDPRYKTIDCGTIVIPEYYGNYLDYAPYTKVHIYLPFIGMVEVNSDDIIGHAVQIKYIVDCYNGSCIAQVFVGNSGYSCLMYQYSGTCSVDIPLTGGSQASIKAGMIGAAASGIASILVGVGSGNLLGGLNAAVSGLGGIAGSVVSSKSSVQHSGSFGASFGAMGAKKPYIVVHTPIQAQVVNYNKEYGFPAHKRVIIGTCSGFIRAFDVHVVSPTATDEEKAQIEEMLKSGVFV